MELDVQRFLRAGGTLADLETRYAIKAKANDTLGIVILNYNQIASPMAERVCQECRALILEMGTWEVVSRSFFKFFNYGEPNAIEIDWATVQVQEKCDGSLVCFYWHRGVWQVATKGTPDASGPVNTHPFTFRTLVECTLAELGCPFAEFTALLNPSVCYSFELTAPENRVIVPHSERSLTLLAAWERETLEELPSETLTELPTPRVRQYPLRTLAEVMEAVSVIAPFAAEGFVVRDAMGARLKIKSAAYVMADRILSHLATPRRRVEAVMSAQYDDFMTQLPDTVRAELEEIRERLAAFRQEVTETFQAYATLPERKAFAAEALRYRYSGLLFQLYGGADLDDSLRGLHPDKLVAWLGLAAEEKETE